MVTCLRIVFHLELLRNTLKATARAIMDRPAQAFNVLLVPVPRQPNVCLQKSVIAGGDNDDMS